MFRRTKRGRRPSGVAVAVVMLLLMLVISFTTAVGVLSRQNYTNASHKEKMLEAEYAFRAALATAMERLAEEPGWNPTQAVPMEVDLSPDGRVAFKLWLDGINRNSLTPVISTSGKTLQRGQCAINIVVLIDGVAITSGFGGAEATSMLIQPPIFFPHNILQINTATALDFQTGPSSLLSYHSTGGISPFLGFPAVPPLNNQGASVRALSDIKLGQTKVYGQAILPTIAALTSSGGSYNTEQRTDDILYSPRFARPDPDGALLPTGTGNQTLPPGNYNILGPGNNATIRLQRGGAYFFQEIYLGENNRIELTGPATAGGCVIYTHTFSTGDGCEINMPPPGARPIPADLELYMTPEPGCEILGFKLGDNCSAAMVGAGHNLQLKMGVNTQLYGAVIASQVEMMNGAAIHYDQALVGVPMRGVPQWAVVNRGRN